MTLRIAVGFDETAWATVFGRAEVWTGGDGRSARPGGADDAHRPRATGQSLTRSHNDQRHRYRRHQGAACPGEAGGLARHAEPASAAKRRTRGGSEALSGLEPPAQDQAPCRPIY